MQPPNPAESLQQTLRTFPQSRSALGMLVGGRILLGAAALGVEHFLWGGIEAEDLGRMDHLLGFAVQVFYGAGWAFLVCAAFWRVGRALDQPLWKIDNTAEALQRFYAYWFLSALLIAVANQAAVFTLWAGSSESGALLILLGVLFLDACIVPVGACFMFVGRFSGELWGEALQPMRRAPATAFFYVVMSFLLYTFLIALSGLGEGNQPLGALLRLGLDAGGALIELVVFAGIFDLCRFHRNHPPEEEDWDL